ncbi:MAG: CinA family protein [Chthoniobacterales bacterium]
MIQQLSAAIIQTLQQASQTVATVESCTGGLLAHCLTNVSGASAVFEQGFITYSNASKIKWVEVPAPILEKHPAVSEEVARAMAEGVRNVSGTTFGLATTGFAGPTGGTEEYPVGTLFLAIAQEKKETLVWKEFFSGEGRIAFKEKAVEALLKRLHAILNLPEDDVLS